MEYADAKEYLYSDGSWRDVYAFDTNLEDLDRFLAFVRPLLTQDSFSVNGEPSDLPMRYSKILETRNEYSCLLGIPVGQSTLNCHFFEAWHLELDFVPKEYDNEQCWEALDDFLKKLSAAIGKEVVMTPENSPDEVYIRYKPV